MIVDDRIIEAVMASKWTPMTSLEIEDLLRPRYGVRTHQTVSAQVRHLHERGQLICVGDRVHAGYRRHVYVTPAYYSPNRHGSPTPAKQKKRQPLTSSQRASLRQKVNAATGSAMIIKLYRAIARLARGLTCRELENQLHARHQSVSARLSELHNAGFVKLHGLRDLPGESRLQPVYVITDMRPKWVK